MNQLGRWLGLLRTWKVRRLRDEKRARNRVYRASVQAMWDKWLDSAEAEKDESHIVRGED